jgi:hypothetical protein
MAETKPITTRDKEAPVVDNRPLRTVEQTINEPPPAPYPSQDDADAILLGEYTGEEEAPPPEGETQEQRAKREEEQRRKREEKQQREAKAAAEQQARYQTR